MRKFIENLLSVLGILLVGTCFLKENLNSIVFISLLLVLLVFIVVGKKSDVLKAAYRQGWALPVYFLIGLLGYCINEHSNTGYLIRLLPFLFGPFLLFYFRYQKWRNLAIASFVCANILFLLYLDMLAIKDMIAAQSFVISEDGAENYRFLYTRYTGDIYNHIYLSTHTLMSIVLLMQFFNPKRILHKVIPLAYLVLHVVILGSRSVVIGALIASIVIAVYRSFSNRQNLKYLAYLFGGILMASGVVYAFKDTLIMNRYSQVFKWYSNWDLLLDRDYSINNRAKIYIVGLSMFGDPHRYDINGTGIASREIENKYLSDFKDSFDFNTNTYNPHNQYIGNFIDWGIAGVLLLCYLLLLPVIQNFRQNRYWISFFWLAFIVILGMESELIRHRGIFLFVLFFAMFAYRNKELDYEE